MGVQFIALELVIFVAVGDSEVVFVVTGDSGVMFAVFGLMECLAMLRLRNCSWTAL